MKFSTTSLHHFFYWFVCFSRFKKPTNDPRKTPNLGDIVFFFLENLREKLIVVFDGILTTQICRFRWN